MTKFSNWRVHHKSKNIILTIVLCLIASSSYAWIEHAYITSLSLNNTNKFDYNQLVTVTPLSSFVEQNQTQIANFIKQNDQWAIEHIPAYHPTPSNLIFDPKNCKTTLTECFIKSLRINPTLPLSDIAYDPHNKLPYHQVESIGKLITKNANKPFLIKFLESNLKYLPPNSQAPIRSIIAANSNLPDFGMDAMLYTNNSDFGREYGFGKQAIGPYNNSEATEALFHRSNYYANSLFFKLKPEIQSSYAEYRFRLFMGLALIAKQNHDLYWASRFSAWGIYYAQEMTQPYNAYLYTGYTTFRAIFVAILDKFYHWPYQKMENNIIGRQRLSNLTALYLLHSKTLGTTMLQHSLQNNPDEEDIKPCSIDYDYLTQNIIRDSYYNNQSFSSVLVKDYPKRLTSQGNRNIDIQLVDIETLYEDLVPSKKAKLNDELNERFRVMGSYTRSCINMVFEPAN